MVVDAQAITDYQTRAREFLDAAQRYLAQGNLHLDAGDISRGLARVSEMFELLDPLLDGAETDDE